MVALVAPRRREPLAASSAARFAADLTCHRETRDPPASCDRGGLTTVLIRVDDAPCLRRFETCHLLDGVEFEEADAAVDAGIVDALASGDEREDGTTDWLSGLAVKSAEDGADLVVSSSAGP
jgi:hypothetical protein